MAAYPVAQGLYDPRREHDACGLGFIADLAHPASHATVLRGIELLRRLSHRGASGADPASSDGAGITTRIPHRFFERALSRFDIELPLAGDYGVAQTFLSRDTDRARAQQRVLEEVARYHGQRVIGWRDVPVDPRAVGKAGRATMPHFAQCFIARHAPQSTFERVLYLIQKRTQALAATRDLASDFYLASLSSRTIVHKGLMLPERLADLFPDLGEDDFDSDFALVHSRFSTNTFPTWQRAHPYRRIAHNGEINTLSGNQNWMRSREASLESRVFGEHLADFRPIIRPEGSDSAALDNLVDFLLASGRSLAHVMMMLIPEAIDDGSPRSEELRGFYAFHASLTEPWDGPAAVLFTDGKLLGGILDRNGLRPAKYVLTERGYVVLASEYGVLDFDDDRIIERGRLTPGGMFAVDLEHKRVLHDAELKARVAAQKPYGAWVAQERQQAEGWQAEPFEAGDTWGMAQRFGVTREDVLSILEPMAASGYEPTGSMGIDTPLAVLSREPVHFARYFKQQFAEVTNPPIDPVREALVMTLKTRLGGQRNLLDETPEHARAIELAHPIVGPHFVDALLAGAYAPFVAARVDATFAASLSAQTNATSAAAPAARLEAALLRLEARAAAAVREGASVLVISDLEGGDALPIPMPMAIATVHNHLIAEGLRTKVSLVADTGFVREVHDLALCIGFGASAVCPRLALGLVTESAMRTHDALARDAAKARDNYVQALKKGLLKVMSKMGISSIQSYRGAQIFEAIGLDRSMCARWLGGVTSALSGVGLETLAHEAELRARRTHATVADASALPEGGIYAWRARGATHAWSPEAVSRLRSAVRRDSHLSGHAGERDERGRDERARADWDAFVREIDGPASEEEAPNAPVTLRTLLKVHTGRRPIDLAEVEPAVHIVRRFSTGAMSFGSISKEAHETLALAMNEIGGRSNTGEGGEDAARFLPLADGRSKRSAIKQVASGRFGVTAHYLVNADELQIKVAQGAKPGEGGQLPGHKVDAIIASLRHSTPGITLVSPPPHHDIYSIEDLAQLILDLKTVNPTASISVKLVAQSGVGTVAAGVAKAGADVIVIAGHDGGTGASPLSSIQHAGMPWELGLAETQQTLLLNNLRGRVELEVDGQLKTGRDVLIGALFGAERFGFATAPLVALGCVMMRKCHLNTCPVGVATQDPVLRARFSGLPDHVIRYFFFVADHVRELLARIGARSLQEVIGRPEWLKPKDKLPSKAQRLDLHALCYVPAEAKANPRHAEKRTNTVGVSRSKLEELATRSLSAKTPSRFFVRLQNRDRAFGADLAGAIARAHGPHGLPDDTVIIDAEGVAGQSFGAFATRGMTLLLTGAANDYVGKGLSGGVLALRPEPSLRLEAHRHAIAGNTVLYGATSGRAFFAGCAGERFGVRLSGASAVVEGVGDHGCEYMTGGDVVILGKVGRNFAAGMSGGRIYLLDGDSQLSPHAEILVEPLDVEDEATLRSLLLEHARRTDSVRATELLATFPQAVQRFRKVWAAEFKALTQQRERQAAHG
jgi:glutamate synthase (NADPH/NADH) large chain